MSMIIAGSSLVNSNALLSVGNSEKTVTRAAFDVGSGYIKICVGEVDPVLKSVEKILYFDLRTVGFSQDLKNREDKQFILQIQEIAFQTIEELKRNAEKYQPKEWAGIATEASRNATNAQEMFDRMRNLFDVNIRIVSQDEEGYIGFETAMATSKVKQDDLVAYDSGGSSFQLAASINGNVNIVKGNYAFLNALDLFFKEVRGLKTASPNPVAIHEADALIRLLREKVPVLPQEFKEKLASPTTTVVGVGLKTTIFGFGVQGTGKNTFSKEELLEAIYRNCNKTDQELQQFSKPSFSVVGMILLYSVLEELGIEKLTFSEANGNCEGILIDSKFWQFN